MVKRKIILLVLITTILFSSCGIFKHKLKTNEPPKIEENKNEEIENLYKSLNLNYLRFNTLYSGFVGNFEQKGKNIPLRGIVKIKKDTFIQISIRPALGIELAKILLTTDSIKYINRVKKEFLVEDYVFINNKFGLDFNYEIIQSIFTDRFFVYPQDNNIFSYNVDYPENDSIYILSAIGKFSDINMNHKVKIAQNNFTVIHNNLLLIDKNRNINISYSNFYKLKSFKFPKILNIKLSENEIKSEINISYKNISLNKRLNSNFVIPNNYKRVKFE